MRKLAFSGLALTLAVAVHVDWHLARPAHHRLSLGWGQHWIFAAIVFFGAGWIIARVWVEESVRAALRIAAVAIVLGQGVEPVLEVVLYQGRIGYPEDPGRWAVFFACMAAGLPALFAAARLCRAAASQRTLSAV